MSVNDLLSSLFTNMRVKIGNIEVLTDLIKFEPETKHLDRYESKSITGSSMKTIIDNALLTNSPPYENIEEIIHELYHINPTALDGYHIIVQGQFRPLLMILHPYPTRIENAYIIRNELVIETLLSNRIDPNTVKLSIICKLRNKTIRELIEFSSQDETLIIRKISIGEEPGTTRIRLFYKDQMMDLVTLIRRGLSIQKPDWFKAITNRFDPNYKALEMWISGKGRKGSDDFERGELYSSISG